MEIELWWLLVLPVFFGLGWVAARIDINQLLKDCLLYTSRCV